MKILEKYENIENNENMQGLKKKMQNWSWTDSNWRHEAETLRSNALTTTPCVHLCLKTERMENNTRRLLVSPRSRQASSSTF